MTEQWYYSPEDALVLDTTVPEGKRASLCPPVCRVPSHDYGRRIAELPKLEREVERLREALEDIARHGCHEDRCMHSTIVAIGMRKLAKAALRREVNGP